MEMGRLFSPQFCDLISVSGTQKWAQGRLESNVQAKHKTMLSKALCEGGLSDDTLLFRRLALLFRLNLPYTVRAFREGYNTKGFYFQVSSIT